jgi:hypothetical protein
MNGTRFMERSFTVPASGGSLAKAIATCTQHGHMEPDRRGNCMRCGAAVKPGDRATSDTSGSEIVPLRSSCETE